MQADKQALASWWKQIEKWRALQSLAYRSSNEVIKPQYAISRLYELTKDRDTYITTEVGQHQMWAAHYWHYKNSRSFITSGGLGTMGFGFPAAIGAQMAFPDKLVIDIAGDGSIQMNIQELATAVIEKLPVKVVILNNLYLGMVRQWQERFYNNNYSGVYLADPEKRDGEVFYPPDFVKLCEAYGAVGIKVTKKADVRPAIDKALSIDKCFFLDFWVEEEENVWPMIPAGTSVNHMIGQPEDE